MIIRQPLNPEFDYVTDSIEWAIAWAENPRDFSSANTKRIFTNLEQSLSTYTFQRWIEQITELHLSQINDLHSKCKRYEAIWKKEHTESSLHSLYCNLRIMKNCVTTCEFLWAKATPPLSRKVSLPTQ